MPVVCYDCTHENATFEAIDLQGPGICNIKEDLYDKPEPIQVEIVQTGEKSTVMGYSCLLTVSTFITKCGFTSITYGMKIGDTNVPVRISEEACRRAHEEQLFSYNGVDFDVNEAGLSYASWYSAGYLDEDHNCDVETFKRNEITYKNSYETSVGRLELKKTSGMLDTSTRMIKFSNGIISHFDRGYEEDDIFGLLYWNVSNIQCKDKLSEVYKGLAQLYRYKRNVGIDGPGVDDIVLVEQPDENRYAGFHLKRKTKACLIDVFDTQQRDLQIFFPPTLKDTIGLSFKVELDVLENDIATNGAFLHIKQSMHIAEGFNTMKRMICNNERKIMFNSLALASEKNPYAFGGHFKEGHSINR